MIDWDRYLVNDDFALLSPGEQRRFWHCKPYGSKDNDRLYIKRTDDGKRLLAYCHHCGDSGSYYLAGSPDPGAETEDYRKLVTTSGLGCTDAASLASVSTPPTSLKLYEKLTTNMENWSEESRKWCEKVNLSQELVSKHHVYGCNNEFVVFTFFVGSDLVLTNARNTTQIGPKYLTDKSDSYVAHFPIGCFETEHPDVCFITEDVASSIHIYEASGYMSLPLLGVNMSDNLIHLLVRLGIKIAMIWLDNDSLTVKKKTRILKDKLNMYITTDFYPNTAEPKTYTYKELKDICSNGVRTNREIT